MKPIIQKLPLDDNSSFVARTYKTPNYETPWHQHEEIELLLSVEGYGKLFAGNFVGDYGVGDIYLFGKNLPHWFREEDEVFCNALVIQFRDSMFGNGFLDMPELEAISSVLNEAKKGLKIIGKTRKELQDQLPDIERQSGFKKVDSLLNYLDMISQSGDYEVLSEFYFDNYSEKSIDEMGRVFEYTMSHYRKRISLEDMADLTNQSVSSFCKVFKKSTKKTFVQFLNEVRIGHACRMLTSSHMSVSEICYSSGFRNWANFSTQFKKIRGMSPTEFRARFSKQTKN